MGKYHRYLTGRPMTVSSGYRTTGTMGDHTTGNCFDVVDDATHRTLELNEKGIRAKMIQEAGRLGIKVLDEYEIDTTYKTGGHLHMDATDWLDKPYNTGITGTIKKGLSNLMDIFGNIGSSFLDMAMATIAGKRWTPTQPATEGEDGIIPSTGEHSIDPKEVYKYYKKKQYSDTAVAAIMGNIMRESTFSGKDVAEYDTSTGSRLGGLGLFQWNGVRTDAMKKWAAENKKDYQDPGVQMAYMYDEVSRSYKNMLPESFNGMAGYEDSEDAAAKLAAEFGRHFEGCEDPNDKRTEYAREFYRRIKNGEFAGAGAMGTVVDTFAAKHPRPQLNLSNNNRRLITNANLSPNSILRSSANIIELVNAIQRIDVHNELNQMIDILKTIANNGGTSVNVINRQAEIKQGRTNLNNNRVRGFNDKGLQRMIDSLENGDIQSGLALASEVARGGQFRNR